MKIQRLALLPITVAVSVLLVACVDEPAPLPTEVPTATLIPTPVPTQTVEERAFTMPTDCFGVVTQSRVDAFESQNMLLLGGPGGKYEHYYADPTPEEQAGGISCIWGDEAAPETTVTISVARLSPQTRANVIDNLIAQGLNEAVVADGISYAQIGDETSAPAILNLIRDDSWISVIEALGGQAFFEEAVELANEVADQVYTP